MATVICTACGAAVPEGSRFCENCGAALAAREEIKQETVEIPPVPPVPEWKVQPASGPEEAPVPGWVTENTLDPLEGAELRRELDAVLAETSPAAPGIPAVPEVPTAPEAPAVPLSPGLAAAAAAVSAASAAPAAPAAPAEPAAPAAPAAPVSDKPGRKSRYAPMTSWGMALEILLMSIPVLGQILMIIWACGGCRKIARRNLARAYVILLLLAIVLTVAAALVLRFCFADELTRLFEQLVPGYTIRWG